MELGLSPPGQLHIDVAGTQQELVWTDWVDNLSTYFTAVGITDGKRQKALLLYTAGEDLRKIYKTLQDTGVDFTSAKTTLDQYFKGKKNLVFERNKFRRTIKDSSESVKTYATRLIELANKCEFEKYTPEGAVVDQIIEHCTSSKLRRKLLSEEKELTLQKVVTIASTMEITEEQASEMERGKDNFQDSVAAIRNFPFKPGQTQDRYNNAKFQAPVVSDAQSSRYNNNRRSQWQQGNNDERCSGCGRRDHVYKAIDCPAFNKTCNFCKSLHHFHYCCNIKQRQEKEKYVKNYKANSLQKSEFNTEASSSANSNQLNAENDSHYLFALDNGTKSDVTLKVDGHPTNFLVDSGSGVDIGDRNTYRNLKQKCNLELHPTSVKIYPYGSSTPLPLDGVVYSNLEFRGTHWLSRLHIVSKEDSGCILGRDSAKNLGLLQVHENVCKLETENKAKKSHLISQYPKVFTGLGKLKKIKIKLNINKQMAPVSQHLYRVPFHVRGKVENKIKELKDLNIIEPVTKPSQWVSPVIPVPKGNDVRLVVDMRQPNRAIQRSYYPVPTVEELLEKFNGHTTFSKVDLNHGYHQIELDEDSRDITTFSTHLGLFRYKRLVQGVSSALEEFQHHIGNLFQGKSGIANIVDDILIGGVDKEDHDKNLHTCLQILQENNLTANPDKCEFGVKELTFFGFSVSAAGIRPKYSKVEAVQAFPAPTCRKEISSFLGLVNFFSRFIPNLSTETEPLRRLLRKDVPWQWTEVQANTFKRLKDLISSELVLRHFQSDRETSLIVDAGPIGLGAILVQKQPDGSLHPVSYASRSLTPVEQRYSQTEREALAVIWGCERYHLYLYGTHFTILTDHEPLTVLYNYTGKPSPRILRWGLRLQSYDFTIKHIPGSTNPADMLSIKPIRYTTAALTQSEETEEYVNKLLVYSIPKAITLSEIIHESTADEQLKKISECITKNNWPRSDVELSPYFNVRHELMTKSGVLMKGHRIVIPKSLQAHTLKLAHESHQGIVKTKALLREKVWWPSIDKDVEDMIKKCIPCLSMAPKGPPEPMKSFSMTKPWDRVHVDICGPFPDGSSVLGVIDASTRWPDIHIINSTKSDTVVSCLEKTFSTHGYPETMITDNAPNLVSVDVSSYCSETGIKHEKSIPYWPQGNAEIERFYRTLGKAIKTMTAEGRNWKKEIFKFLLSYRNTPHCSTGSSPAMLLMNRKLKDKIPCIQEVNSSFYKAKKRDDVLKVKSKKHYDQRKRVRIHQIRVGDYVLIRQKKKNKLSTVYETRPSKVMKVEGSAITVHRRGKSVIRNSSDVQKIPDYCGYSDDSDPFSTDSDSDDVYDSSSSNDENNQRQFNTGTPERRCSTRQTKETDFYGDYITHRLETFV